MSGGTATVTVLRSQREYTLKLRLGVAPAIQGVDTVCP